MKKSLQNDLTTKQPDFCLQKITHNIFDFVNMMREIWRMFFFSTLF
jgi:hypothetical protein